MFPYLSAVPATNSSVVLAMMVASLLPLVFAILAKLFGGFKSKDNANSYETLPVFLAAVIVALLFFVPLSVVTQLAWLYVILRIIYGLAYIANWATFRSIIWSLSLACPLMMFYLAIRLS